MSIMKSALASMVLLFATMPFTTTYTLHDYSFGSGGGTTSTTTYKAETIAGEQSDDNTFTTTNTIGSGLQPTQQANEPAAPTITNPANWYNKLHVVINDGGNPTDATFVIAISTDNFSTTNYVHNDNTIGPVLNAVDYQTYTAWGGATGFDVIGLARSTTYYFKVKANTGKYTESPYSPVVSLATSDVQLTFDIDVSAVDTSTSPPYNVPFGNLLVNSVNDSPVKVWFSLDTNAVSGGTIYILSKNAGLKSTVAGYTIGSLSGDLSVQNEGFGAQATSATQASGGPLASVSPYAVAGSNVGIVDTSYRAIFSTSAQVGSGRASFLLKAKTKSMTPSATDYTDTFTAVAAPAF